MFTNIVPALRKRSSCSRRQMSRGAKMLNVKNISRENKILIALFERHESGITTSDILKLTPNT